MWETLLEKTSQDANMIEKIARDVSGKLNATPSRDFDGMVGIETHLREMESLLDFDNDEVKRVGIVGPAGIGKTTIARALHSRLSNRFQLTCFVDNLKGSYLRGLDELRLQEQFLSNLLNQDGLKIHHSGVLEERLCKQRVLIILDDVNNIMQLMALANDKTWFGPGSRIVVTTENKELLQQHGINNTYHVGFPSNEQAFKILCKYAFRKYHSYHHGYEKLVQRVTQLCDYLPLGLRVVGSSLCGKNEEEWEEVILRLETKLDPDIEDVLRVSYESLDVNEKTLFLHIAVFFNYKDDNLVETMFADSGLNVIHGLQVLDTRSLIEIRVSTNGKRIVMHRLLQQVGKMVIHKQEPWKRQILMDANEICDVLEEAKGTRNVVGISFDICGINEVSISKKAFKRMPNLRFVRVYKSKDGGDDRMHIHGKMEFPRSLRLLNWEAYPSKSLPPKFHVEHLVELDMKCSKLECLWQGAQPLKNLKKMDLSGSFHLKEVPDLSNATNLKYLKLSDCTSLVEIPSSCTHLHKLIVLWVDGCINLEVIPTHMNLASLKRVCMTGCSRLRYIPSMSTNITSMHITKTAVEVVLPSVRLCSRLRFLSLRHSGKLKEITHFPMSLKQLNLGYTDIERIPDCIKALHLLQELHLSSCKRLTSLPELPSSLEFIFADDCESLETIFYPLDTPNASFNFTNCFKFGRQARRAIIKRSFYLKKALLPGSQVPAGFDHRAKGNSLTIHSDGDGSYTGILVCVVISPNQRITEEDLSKIVCRHIEDDNPVGEGLFYVGNVYKFRTEHLLIFHHCWLSTETSREMVFEFSSKYHDFDVIECGAMILTDESIKGTRTSNMSNEIVIELSRREQGLDVIECGAKILIDESIKGTYESGSDQVFDDEIDKLNPAKRLKMTPNTVSVQIESSSERQRISEDNPLLRALQFWEKRQMLGHF
ncbi:PREDICTED: disease resistance protein RML1B-like isoform X1 [Camelina sativa]|uniref:Disease resistance protein RML1B-like isoform X1 n=1 Tax=Camelina sativa TaxID=90675 RepID=A0ABM0SZ01_CAMSA|nr:PREDICTED: disease resistance protein RML1B-like isoform X1 [Camelina sativa]